VVGVGCFVGQQELSFSMVPSRVAFRAETVGATVGILI